MTDEEFFPDQLLQWIISAVDSRAKIGEIRRLRGSTSSDVHSISLTIHGEKKEYVLRQFTNRSWLEDEPDLAKHEAESLRMSSQTGINSPLIIAYDETGHESGIPAVLMTKVEGDVDLLPGKKMDDWLDELAKMLAAIHNVEVIDFPWNYFPYSDSETMPIPQWSSQPELWGKLFKIVRGQCPDTKPCFIHRDYHPTNVLWENGKVSGVVDWVNACRGPAGIDVGHCRLNLARLYGITCADAFLAAYERYGGSDYTYHPYWDLVSLVDGGPPEVYPGWPVFGVTSLTNEMMVERTDQYLISLMNRYDQWVYNQVETG